MIGNSRGNGICDSCGFEISLEESRKYRKEQEELNKFG